MVRLRDAEPVAVTVAPPSDSALSWNVPLDPAGACATKVSVDVPLPPEYWATTLALPTEKVAVGVPPPVLTVTASDVARLNVSESPPLPVLVVPDESATVNPVTTRSARTLREKLWEALSAGDPPSVALSV